MLKLDQNVHRNGTYLILTTDWLLSNYNPTPGGTPLYKPYRYVPPQRVGFLRRFGLKTSIDFDHFGLESGLIFKGTTGMYERIYFFQFQMSKKEREICEFEMDFKKSFLFLF